MLSPRGKKELKINQRRILINSIEIGIPAPEQVFILGQRQTPHGKVVGRVRNSKTLNYKSFTPHRDGLFCERIFGPVQSYICACGKQGPLTTSKGTLKFCPRCEVEYTDQRARRYRVGYIGLVSPVTHIWHLKGRPSYLSLFLGKRKKTLATLAYCNDYLVEQAFSKVAGSRVLGRPEQTFDLLTAQSGDRAGGRQQHALSANRRFASSPTPPGAVPRGARSHAQQTAPMRTLRPVHSRPPARYAVQPGRVRKDGDASGAEPAGAGQWAARRRGVQVTANTGKRLLTKGELALARSKGEGFVLKGADFFKTRILKGLKESLVIKGLTLSREQEKFKVGSSEVYFIEDSFSNKVDSRESDGSAAGWNRVNFLKSLRSPKVSTTVLPTTSAQVTSETSQKKATLSYTRSQTLPFLPTFICEFHLRDGLLSFFDTFPPTEDIPIPVYCKIPRRYPLRDVHKFMADQAFSKVEIEQSSTKRFASQNTFLTHQRWDKNSGGTAPAAGRLDAGPGVKSSLHKPAAGAVASGTSLPTARTDIRSVTSGNLLTVSNRAYAHPTGAQGRRLHTAPMRVHSVPRRRPVYNGYNLVKPTTYRTPLDTLWLRSNLKSSTSGSLRLIRDTLESDIGWLNKTPLRLHSSPPALRTRRVRIGAVGFSKYGVSLINEKDVSQGSIYTVHPTMLSLREILLSMILNRIVTTLIGLTPNLVTYLNGAEPAIAKPKVFIGAEPAVIMARRVGSQSTLQEAITNRNPVHSKAAAAAAVQATRRLAEPVLQVLATDQQLRARQRGGRVSSDNKSSISRSKIISKNLRLNPVQRFWLPVIGKSWTLLTIRLVFADAWSDVAEHGALALTKVWLANSSRAGRRRGRRSPPRHDRGGSGAVLVGQLRDPNCRSNRVPSLSASANSGEPLTAPAAGLLLPRQLKQTPPRRPAYNPKLEDITTAPLGSLRKPKASKLPLEDPLAFLRSRLFQNKTKAGLIDAGLAHPTASAQPAAGAVRCAAGAGAHRRGIENVEDWLEYWFDRWLQNCSGVKPETRFTLAASGSAGLAHPTARAQPAAGAVRCAAGAGAHRRGSLSNLRFTGEAGRRGGFHSSPRSRPGGARGPRSGVGEARERPQGHKEDIFSLRAIANRRFTGTRTQPIWFVGKRTNNLKYSNEFGSQQVRATLRKPKKSASHQQEQRFYLKNEFNFSVFTFVQKVGTFQDRVLQLFTRATPNSSQWNLVEPLNITLARAGLAHPTGAHRHGVKWGDGPSTGQDGIERTPAKLGSSDGPPALLRSSSQSSHASAEGEFSLASSKRPALDNQRLAAIVLQDRTVRPDSTWGSRALKKYRETGLPASQVEPQRLDKSASAQEPMKLLNGLSKPLVHSRQPARYAVQAPHRPMEQEPHRRPAEKPTVQSSSQSSIGSDELLNSADLNKTPPRTAPAAGGETAPRWGFVSLDFVKAPVELGNQAHEGVTNRRLASKPDVFYGKDNEYENEEGPVLAIDDEPEIKRVGDKFATPSYSAEQSQSQSQQLEHDGPAAGAVEPSVSTTGSDSYMKAQLDLQAIQEVLSYTGGGALRELLRCFDTQAFSVILLNEIKLLREYHKGYFLYEYNQISRETLSHDPLLATQTAPPAGGARARSSVGQKGLVWYPDRPAAGCTSGAPPAGAGRWAARRRGEHRPGEQGLQPASQPKQIEIDNETEYDRAYAHPTARAQLRCAAGAGAQGRHDYEEFPEEINRFSRAIHRNARRLKIVQLLMRNKRRPEWMLISALPVLPPDLRPILQMSENLIVASDLNTLYQRVIYRNNRQYKLRIVEWSYATSLQRLVQDAVDRLIENGKGGSKPFLTPGGRPLKSLSDTLKGKKGRFRLNLLGKRVDFSGRSVIVVSPHLKIHECGLPRDMALELYQYLLIRQMLLKRQVSSVIIAKRVIRQQKAFVWDTLRELIYHHPLLLNRAPTLHRLGIQAFQPKLVLGSTILLHPLVCSGFNADFDGDQMGVHLPLCDEARAEAWDLLWSRNNLLSPATGEPILLPSQDMVLGFYHMTALLPSRNANSITQDFGLRSQFRGAAPTIASANRRVAGADGPTAPSIAAQATGIDPVHSPRGSGVPRRPPAVQPKGGAYVHRAGGRPQAEQGRVDGSGRPRAHPESELALSKGCGLVQIKTTSTQERTPVLFEKGFHKSHFFSSLDVVRAYQNADLDIHTPIWLQWNGKLENNDSDQTPIEVRINTFGVSTQLYPSYKYRKDVSWPPARSKSAETFNIFIRTTPGRVVVNNIFPLYTDREKTEN